MSRDESAKQLVRAWTQWAGRGNGPAVAALARGLGGVVDTVSLLSTRLRKDPFLPSTIRGRVRRCQRGGADSTPAAWIQDGEPLLQVNIVVDGHELTVEGSAFTLQLADFPPVGLLDYPPRPRATAPNGTEYASGVVLRRGDHVIELLMLRDDELAFVAIMAGWPSPTDLPHGHNAADIISAAP